jgi:hypothetical protein
MKVRERIEARRLRAEGMSLRGIAAELGVSLSTASVWTRDVPRGRIESGPPRPALDTEAEARTAAPLVLRRCSKCGQDLPEEHFNLHAAGRQWWCRSCFRAYYEAGAEHHRSRSNALKTRRVAEARAYVLEMLRERRCVDCGEADVVVLEFDHLSDKQAHVATLVSRGVGLARIEAEVARCEIVCVNCHRRRTAARAGWRRVDGDLDSVRWRSPRHERNVRHVFAVLAASACTDCGEHDMCVLDFDHRGAKTGMVMRLARNEVGLARLQAEIAVCEVRCANCHRRRTAVEGGWFRTVA